MHDEDLFDMHHRFEGLEGTTEERKMIIDEMQNRSSAANVLRMPARPSTNAVGKLDDAGGPPPLGSPPVVEFEDEDLDDVMILLTAKERMLMAQLKGDVDVQVAMSLASFSWRDDDDDEDMSLASFSSRVGVCGCVHPAAHCVGGIC